MLLLVSIATSAPFHHLTRQIRATRARPEDESEEAKKTKTSTGPAFALSFDAFPPLFR